MNIKAFIQFFIDKKEVFIESFIDSLIAFSIVFIVLFGLTLMIYIIRFLTGGSSSSSSGSAPDVKTQATAAPKPSATDVKARHVAAVTTAIMAATRGRGRIISVTPAVRMISSESTKNWRTAAIMGAISRRLAPSWKR